MADSDDLVIEVLLDADVEIPGDITHENMARLIDSCLVAEGRDGVWQFSIAFVDEHEIVDLHQRFMNLPEPTDILTFPYEPDPLGNGGDIAICVPVAAANALEHGKSLSWELCFLVLHGVLHVLGWDDQTDADRAAMLARQEQILTEFGLTA